MSEGGGVGCREGRPFVRRRRWKEAVGGRQPRREGEAAGDGGGRRVQEARAFGVGACTCLSREGSRGGPGKMSPEDPPLSTRTRGSVLLSTLPPPSFWVAAILRSCLPDRAEESLILFCEMVTDGARQTLLLLPPV
ncbi:uncharacterized protein LOC122055372 [Zingiber officinale]|uniref:uncharacterized protein LOC122055372 n=1 Tax=Zingiber officinale TaxID=94328 RepID=UPI001C4CBC90|nr:uncharacterized protein LOC122055372 [Zingiber officinale]